MRWVLHGSGTHPAVADALAECGQRVEDAATSGVSLETAGADAVRLVRQRRLELISSDASLVTHLLEDRPPFGRCVVYLQLPGEGVEQHDAVCRLFARYKRLSLGKLYTLTASRVKVRQLPAARATPPTTATPTAPGPSDPAA